MPRMFIEAEALPEIKSWFNNDVFNLVDIRKFKPKNFVTGRWALTVKRDRDGKFLLRGFQDAIMREVEEKRTKRTEDQQRLHDGYAVRHLQVSLRGHNP